jgi:hypothetical protein
MPSLAVCQIWQIDVSLIQLHLIEQITSLQNQVSMLDTILYTPHKTYDTPQHPTGRAGYFP